MPKTEQQLTVGQICIRLSAPLHRVSYAIRALELQPRSWAGNARVFAEEDFSRIKAFLDQPASEAGDSSRQRPAQDAGPESGGAA